MHTIRPLDIEAIETCLGAKAIVTVEEHGINGGMGSAVAEYLAPKKVKPPQLIIGCECRFVHAGDYPYLIEQYGLDVESIASRIKTFMNGL
jgi:transketolase